MAQVAPLAVVWRALGTAERLAVDALMAIAIALMPLMALAITFEVVVRYFFNAPTIWVVDASAYALLWVAFLAAPWLVRHGGHIRIEFVTDRLPPRARRGLEVLTSILGALIMAVVLWQTTAETIQAYVRNTHTIGSWEIPRVLVWWVMPVGSLFTVLEFLRSAWLTNAELRGERVAEAPPVEPAITTSQVT